MASCSAPSLPIEESPVVACWPAGPACSGTFQALSAGLRVGDVITGLSPEFGHEEWSVVGKDVEEIESMIRSR